MGAPQHFQAACSDCDKSYRDQSERKAEAWCDIHWELTGHTARMVVTSGKR